MTRNTTRLTAVLLAVLLLGAMFAPVDVTAETPLATSALDDGTSPSAASGSTAGTAAIHESLSNETGETELFLLLPDVPEVDRQGGPDAVVDALQSTAERTQGPVIETLGRYDAVTVEETFWIRNSILVTADLDEIDLETLAAIDGVERIEPNVVFDAPEPVEATPVDDARDDNVTYGLDLIDAPEVWADFGATGEGIRVAVADTGVYTDHPDVELATEDGWYDPMSDSAEPVDDFGHGTHVTGTISGGSASGTAIGVAPDVEIGAVRVCNALGCSSDAIVESFEWAVETDSDIVNYSLGVGAYGIYSESVYNTMDAGTLVVAGAGNEGDGDAISPAAPWDSLSVGAVAENHSVAGFSSGDKIEESDFGGLWRDRWPERSYIVPDAATPGVDVYSANSANGQMPGCDGAEYCEVSGTSMATPHMTGIAALVLSADPSLGPWELREQLPEATWKPEDWNPNDAMYYDPETETDSRYGAGIMNAYEAVSQVADPEPPQEPEFAVSIDDTNAPVMEGEDLVVDARVENVGNASGEQSIELAAFDGAVVDDRTVGLEAGASTTLELIWRTEVGDAGSGEVTVSSADHSDSTSVEIEPEESDPGCELLGDVDGDGQVSSLDATMTQRFIAGLDPGTFDENCADLNGDGDITPADVTAIHQTIVGVAR